MTDFDAGRGRRNFPDDSARVPASGPAPRGGERDRIPAYVETQQLSARARVSGLLDRLDGETGPIAHISGPLPDLPWWSESEVAHAGRAAQARHRNAPEENPGGRPPTGPAPLPPRPAGAWSRMPSRPDTGPGTGGVPGRGGRPGGRGADDDATEAHPLEPAAWQDQTGGLEVLGAYVDEEPPRRRRRRDRRAAHEAEAHDPYAGGHGGHDGLDGLDGHDEHDDHSAAGVLHEELLGVDADSEHPLADDEIPLKPYDTRRVRRRRRRRRIAGLVALTVLVGLVLGIVFGGSKLLGVINPSSRDYTGAGYGAVNVRVHEGDTLSDIARTLVQADVIAGTGHFVSAAKKEPSATGISPGVYAMHLHMSGQSALTKLLDPASRLLSRVTIPEGLTAAKTLQKVADETHLPLADLQAAAQNPAQLGLPAYANGSLEGFLFPATYDFEPHTTAVAMLKAMVSRSTQVLDQLQIPADQRLTVLTKASIVQAEAGSVEDMGKVARVLENRLGTNMPLQLDTTVNYATGKTGLTTTDEDRANPSPYNTYVHPGLPPGPISNPGEEAIRAVLSPTAGPWLYFVVVNPDTGETRFATTAAEHQQNVALFQQWLRAHPNG